MNNKNDNDFLYEPVPINERRSTIKQILVWIGFGYVATGLFIGGTFAGLGSDSSLSFDKMILAIILGMGTLFILTSLLGVIAQKTGFNLSLLSKFSYGTNGAQLPMLAMGLLTLGWFSAITGMVGDIWGKFIGNPTGIIIFSPSDYGFSGANITLEIFLSCLIAGILFTLTAMYGIKGLEKIATPVSPVIMLLAVFAGIYLISDYGGWDTFITIADKHSGLSLSAAVTMLIGSWIAGAVMGIDLFRFNKNILGVLLCSAACFILTNPLLNIVGYISMTTVQDANYLNWMIDKGFIFAVIGVVTWTLSLWTTNNAELYCNANYIGPSLKNFGFKVNNKKLILFVGILGTIMGSIGFYQILFADFINYLGIMAPPLAGPILADYYFFKNERYTIENIPKQVSYNISGLISSISGMLFGLISYLMNWFPNWPISLISLFVAIVAYILIKKTYNLSGENSHEKSVY